MRRGRRLALTSAATLAVVLGPLPARPADTPLAVAGPVSSLGDTCATAIVIPWSDIISAAGYLTTGTTGTSNDVPVTCGADGSDAFYTFTAGADSNLFLTTCVTSLTDTVLSFKTFADCTTSAVLACNDDNCQSCAAAPTVNNFSSTLANIPVTAGVQYAVQIDNFARTASALFQLRIYETSTTMLDLALFQSLEPTRIVDPAHIVAMPVTSPYFQPIPEAPVVYYQVDDDRCSAVSVTLRVVRLGLDGEFSF